MKYYIDASVVVKWYKEKEEFESVALRLLDDIVEFEVTGAASSLTILELIRALQKIGVQEKIIKESLSSLDSLFKTCLIKTNISDECISLSKELMLSSRLYASDAIHLSSAILEDCDVILTADSEHMLGKNVVKIFSKNYGIDILHIKQYK
ncbi:MAG: type II toxin-antitoxin system VapC family toxin [Thermoplasmatales archaeon]|nr:type II toxin-antitoxin system VapC family toxin [Thermoplasmatales archaeon]